MKASDEEQASKKLGAGPMSNQAKHAASLKRDCPVIPSNAMPLHQPVAVHHSASISGTRDKNPTVVDSSGAVKDWAGCEHADEAEACMLQKGNCL